MTNLAPRLSGADLDPFRPWHNVVHQGSTVLFVRPDGTLQGGREGLFDFDTRILSHYCLTLDGRAPQCVSSGALESDRWSAHLRVPRAGGNAAGPTLPQDTFEIALARRVGRGMAEQLVVTNHSMTPAETELVIELEADFADVQEAASGERQQHGTTAVAWDGDEPSIRFTYHADHDGSVFERALRLRVVAADSAPTWDGRALRFALRLPARGAWRARLSYGSLVDGRWREPIADTRPAAGDGPPPAVDCALLPDARDVARERWRERRPHLDSPNPVVGLAFEQAAEDLFALRNWELDQAVDAWVVNAGVPTFTGLFGRDALTAAWQSALVGPEIMRGTLAVVAATQSHEDSAWRDQEPGKMIHELRRGPLAELDIIPQRAYYGTQTTPAMFLLALSEFWHWTGNTAALHRYRDAALRAMEWARVYGDRDGDGFLEYVKRSPRGLKNHGWKDSDEAIRYPDGRLVENPIATVEEQAFHCIALQRMAEILVVLGEDRRAAEFLERARQLKRRWHDAFWMEDEGFYAMALDAKKQQVRSIGSNPGHALGVGIVPVDRAPTVADRLLAPDLFSGWGVRTLSSAHPSYNPFAYHLGTVWPVENATFSLGFKRYGLDDHVERLISGLFAAAGHFQDLRLPESLGGHDRDAFPVPTIYPGSNSPQAWSASATIQLVQVLLGIYPFAPAHLLALLRPKLPSWLDVVTIRRLQVGDATVSIRFERQADGTTRHQVLERDGRLLIMAVPPPQDAHAGEEGVADRIKTWALEHTPGRVSSAMRIALGDLES
jgi:glycogen debranching enzyme